MAPSSLFVGDRPPAFIMPAHTGEDLDIRDFQGELIVLFFYPSSQDPDAIATLCAFRDLYKELTQLNLKFFVVSIDSHTLNAQIVEIYHLPFPLVTDTNAQLCQAFGCSQQIDSRTLPTYSTFVLSPNYKIIKIYSPQDLASHPAQILADIPLIWPPESPRHVLYPAPILLIPNVLEPEFCRHLIHVWETQGNGDSGFMVERDGKTVGEYDYTHKIRRDHFVTDPVLKDQIRAYISRRVCPEIYKIHSFEATRFEDFRIACYESERGGFFRRHRDNTTKGTAHRRFAMTLNLNVGEYEGGYLRFPEYSPHLYRPDTGSAIIFSCSMLHEATDVTSGRRFALLSFLYGEKEAKIRDEMREKGVLASS